MGGVICVSLIELSVSKDWILLKKQSAKVGNTAGPLLQPRLGETSPTPIIARWLTEVIHLHCRTTSLRHKTLSKP